MTESITIRPAYVQGSNGSIAEVIGLKMGTPQKCEERPVLHIRFSDGKEDYIPLALAIPPNAAWEFLSPHDVGWCRERHHG